MQFGDKPQEEEDLETNEGEGTQPEITAKGKVPKNLKQGFTLKEQSSQGGQKAPASAHEERIANLQKEESKKEKFSEEGLSKAVKSEEQFKNIAPEPEMPKSQEGTQKLEEQPLKKHEETWHEEKPSEKESDVDK